MSFGDVIKEKRGILGAAAAMLVVAAVLFVFQLRGAGSSVASATPKTFFSIDDGKSWFVDDSSKIPPFEKDGKQAVQAYVFRSPDGKEFVNYLERYIPEAKRALESAQNSDPKVRPKPGQGEATQGAYMGGREVKRPGNAKWIRATNYKDASKITDIKCPGGGTEAEPVKP